MLQQVQQVFGLLIDCRRWIAPGGVEVDRDLEEENGERGSAARVPRRGARELRGDIDAGDDIVVLAESYAAVQLRDEVERIELEQHVVAEKAVDVEAGGCSVELDFGAELHGVRYDGEVALDLQPRIVVREQADADARHVPEAIGQRRNRWNIVEVRVEAADAEREQLLLTPRDHEREAPGDGEQQQPGIEQVGAKEQVAAIQI